MNNVDSMNIEALSPRALEDALEKKLRELLESVPWLREISVSRNPAEFDRAFDLLAEFKQRGGPKIELWVECKRDPRPAQFPHVARKREFREQKLTREQVWVFAAPYISPRMAEVCREHGWSWFDLAGNCRISIPEILHLERTGNPPVHKRGEPSVNLSTPEAARVLRALLNPEHLGKRWTQRALREECHPSASLGLVNKVIAHLRDEALVEESPRRGLVVSEPQKLLFLWRDHYRMQQHQRWSYFSLLQGSKLRGALAALAAQVPGGMAYAAFSAAEAQAPHVRQPRTWLYMEESILPRFESGLEAKRVDSGENLVVWVPRDEGVFYALDRSAGDGLPGTNLIQTYVDLWHSGGRGREAAEALLEQRIFPEWRKERKAL